MGWQRTLEFMREACARGVRMHPQFTTQRLGLHLRLADTFVFDEMPAWRAVLPAAAPERSGGSPTGAGARSCATTSATVQRAAPFRSR